MHHPRSKKFNAETQRAQSHAEIISSAILPDLGASALISRPTVTISFIRGIVGLPRKAAEGRRTPKRWRDCHGARVREASWSASSPLALFPTNQAYPHVNVLGMPGSLGTNNH
jgi:hypothetical protein